MEYRYYTVGREPKKGDKLTLNGRDIIIRWIGNERYLITRAKINRQPELLIDQGLLALRVGYVYAD